MIRETLFCVIVLLFNLIAHSQERDLDQFYGSPEVIKELKPSYFNLDSLTEELIQKNQLDESSIYIKDFVQNQSFFLDQLNRSGRVFFKNEICTYLNLLKDEILTKNNIQRDIIVYLVDIDNFNAFANDIGTIYVNIATVAKASCEDELMAILAHEISHVIAHHSYNYELLKNNPEWYSETENFQEFNYKVDLHAYSRGQELAADSMSYDLLQNMGMDLHNISTLFDKLRFPDSPAATGNHDFSVAFCKAPSVMSYIQEVSRISEAAIPLDSLKKVIGFNTDTIRTHPSAEERENFYFEILSETDASRMATGKFKKMKELANIVYVKTLIKEGRYYNALYELSDLINRIGISESLAKNQLKLLALITQEKYLPHSYTRILNTLGNQNNNQDYLAFRRSALSIPPLEMNIITLITCEQFMMDYPESSYLKEVYSTMLQYLYYHNPKIIHKKPDLSYTLQTISREKVAKFENPEKFDLYETRYELDSIQSHNYVIVNTQCNSIEFVNEYANEFRNTENLTTSIESYKQKRNQLHIE